MLLAESRREAGPSRAHALRSQGLRWEVSLSFRLSGSRSLNTLLPSAICAVIATAPELFAQSPASVIGRVTAETGLGLTGADIAVSVTQLRTTTDDRGEFRCPNVPAGTIEVRARRLGFRPDAVMITVPQSGT